MIAMHSVHASSSQLLKSFEVDSIHMPLSSQVKSSRMWSSRRWSTLGHFSLKSGHVSVPQRLAGLHVVGCCERFYKMSHVRSWLLCLWRRKKSTGVGVAFLERRTNCSLHATVCVEAYWFWVQKDRSMLGLSLGLCSRRRFESSESVHCIPNPWVKKLEACIVLCTGFEIHAVTRRASWERERQVVANAKQQFILSTDLSDLVPKIRIFGPRSDNNNVVVCHIHFPDAFICRHKTGMLQYVADRFPVACLTCICTRPVGLPVFFVSAGHSTIARNHSEARYWCGIFVRLSVTLAIRTWGGRCEFLDRNYIAEMIMT